MKATASVNQGFLTEVKVREHSLKLSQPAPRGGDEGMTPMDALAGSLAACKVMAARAYADHKGYALESAHAEVEVDSAALEREGKLSFKVELKLKGNLSDEEIQRITQAVKACHVAKVLETTNEIAQNVTRG